MRFPTRQAKPSYLTRGTKLLPSVAASRSALDIGRCNVLMLLSLRRRERG